MNSEITAILKKPQESALSSGGRVGVEQKGHGLESRHGPPARSASRRHQGLAASL